MMDTTPHAKLSNEAYGFWPSFEERELPVATEEARCSNCGHFLLEIIEGEVFKVRVRCIDSKCRAFLLVEKKDGQLIITRLR